MQNSMDYKYIEQLLERYWRLETSLEEEEILRAFFSQKDVPAELTAYKALFAYEHKETQDDVLDESFDEKILSIVEHKKPVKARTISLTQRLMPLFKAAAVVAIFLTLGNAAQVAFDTPQQNNNVAEYEVLDNGASVALSDTLKVDTMQKAKLQTEEVLFK